MPKEKKIPLRMCIACREMKPKKEMLRVVKTLRGKFRSIFRGNLRGGARIFATAKGA